jgi:glycosyltransferase involved in cell wall biosynthesis
MAIVTIILPNFNHSNFLQKRLDSISNQTFKDWEMIIIDDCSTDNSVSILKNFQKSFPKKVTSFIINDQNSGSGYQSWMKGIQLCKTKYVWIAETDDYAANNFLEMHINLLEKYPNAALAFCNSQYIDESGNFLYTSKKRTKELIGSDSIFSEIDCNILLNKMPMDTYITNASSVVFRNLKASIPRTIFNFKQCSDIFLWTFLIKNKSIIFNSELLNYFRQHQNSTTTINYNLNLKNIYLEKFKYIKYFKKEEKFKSLIISYIEKFVIHNKREWISNSIFKEIHLPFSLKLYFYCNLIIKIFKKNVI